MNLEVDMDVLSPAPVDTVLVVLNGLDVDGDDEKEEEEEDPWEEPSLGDPPWVE